MWAVDKSESGFKNKALTEKSNTLSQHHVALLLHFSDDYTTFYLMQEAYDISTNLMWFGLQSKPHSFPVAVYMHSPLSLKLNLIPEHGPWPAAAEIPQFTFWQKMWQWSIMQDALSLIFHSF